MRPRYRERATPMRVRSPLTLPASRVYDCDNPREGGFDDAPVLVRISGPCHVRRCRGRTRSRRHASVEDRPEPQRRRRRERIRRHRAHPGEPSASGRSGRGPTFFESTPDRTLIARWDGYAWTKIPSPNVGDQDNELSAVSVRARSNAWAVGSAEDPSEVAKTLIEHWNGHAWAVVPESERRRRGRREPPLGRPRVLRHRRLGRGRQHLERHLDDAPGGGRLEHRAGARRRGTALLARGDHGRAGFVAAVRGGLLRGPGHGRQPNPDRTMNGTAWTIVPSPAPGVSSTMTDVVAVSGHELWAVGTRAPLDSPARRRD